MIAGAASPLSMRRSVDFAIMGSAIAVAVLIISDLLTHSLNLSILYSIPMYLLAIRLPRMWVGIIAVGLVVLTYCGLFMGVRPPGLQTAEQLFDNYRMVNRSLSSVSILATALVAGWQRQWSMRMLQRVEEDPVLLDHPIYVDLMDQVRFFATLLIALCITTSLVIVDWTTTAEFNLPILYVVPMVLCVLSGSVRTIWFIGPILVVLTWAGFWASRDQMQVNPLLPLMNRIIASLMLIALAIVGTYIANRNRGKRP